MEKHSDRILTVVLAYVHAFPDTCVRNLDPIPTSLFRSNSHLSSKRLCICPPSCSHRHSHSLLATSHCLSSTRSSLLFSKKLILTKKTYLTTDPSQICHSYPS